VLQGNDRRCRAVYGVGLDLYNNAILASNPTRVIRVPALLCRCYTPTHTQAVEKKKFENL
jgi:hypothetical protein